MQEVATELGKIIFIGNYSPRKCGIATFTTDLCESFALKNPGTTCQVVAITDTPNEYKYPERVCFEIAEQSIDSYKLAAEYINMSGADAVCLEHEYGIFGGPSGSYILTLLRSIHVPIITTFHTILLSPTTQQERVLLEIANLSHGIIAMTQKSAELLNTRYGISEKKIQIIPHGIPDVESIGSNDYKEQFAVNGKTVMLTFGLLSPNKGIEYVIRALPEIVKKFPSVLYIVVGQTHPNILRNEGENYRIGLQQLAAELGVEEYIRFHNRFVPLEDLKEFLVLTDIYITPYLNEQQIVSGTLAYAFGAGNVVVSTPYWHASELLSDGNGILVPFKDSGAISDAMIQLLGDENKIGMIQKNAFCLGRAMIWATIVDRYKSVFLYAQDSVPLTERKNKYISQPALENRVLPDIKIDHIVRMTDSTGILQHALYSVPNFYEGYCTDDNARALILTSYLQEMDPKRTREIEKYTYSYLAFLSYAFCKKSGRFKNFLSYHREWLEEIGSEDSHGRAIWALGACIGRTWQTGFQKLAGELFIQSIGSVLAFSSPRAWAFSIIGIYEYMRLFPDNGSVRAIWGELASRLHDLYLRHRHPKWLWFEGTMSYDNAKLSHALLVSGWFLHNEVMFNDGLESLGWLCQVQTDTRNNFMPVGSDFVYSYMGERPVYDQQPIEAHATVSACLEAYRITKDILWYDTAWKTFQWFTGRNSLYESLYDPYTGGCCDGLHRDRVNMNQGAESTIVFLLALAEMTSISNELKSLKEPFL